MVVNTLFLYKSQQIYLIIGSHADHLYAPGLNITTVHDQKYADQHWSCVSPLNETAGLNEHKIDNVCRIGPNVEPYRSASLS